MHAISAKKWPKDGEPIFVLSPIVKTWRLAVNHQIEMFGETVHYPVTVTLGMLNP